ncbi:MAG: hypothetical protein CVV58_03275 [Tenericutes bacterium HGW-Tenericutes-3]|nr:MAG: hypothetical protein CVV58_03275 [Tenericutes bacterium HGW-Tenericutes-3]
MIKYKVIEKRGSSMGNTLIFALNAILPIVLLVLLGYSLKKISFIDESFVKILNKYVFKIGLPILLFYNVYSINSLKDIEWTIVLFAVTAILIVYALGLLFVTLAIKDRQQKGVILQGIFRSNFALIGVPLASALGGIQGLAVVSILSAFVIPLFNILSVISLTIFQKNEIGERISLKKLLKTIVTNPLIIGVFTGLVVLAIRTTIPRDNGILVFSIKDDIGFLYTFIKSVSQTASPMALIALGGQFEFAVVKNLAKKIAIGVAWKVAIVPAMVLTSAVFLAPKIPSINDSYPALIALFGSPIAVSSSIMVSEMGGDKQLAAQLVVWSTISSILTIFLSIVIMKHIGAI